MISRELAGRGDGGAKRMIVLMERARQGRTHAFVNEGSRPYVGKGVIQRIIDVAPDEPAPRRGAAMQDPALADTGADPHRAATRPCPRVWATGARTPQPNLPDAPGSVSTVADSLMFDDKTCRHATYQRRSLGAGTAVPSGVGASPQ